MKKEDTGLRAETLKHAVDLFQRTVSELVLNGYSVNTGLFRAVPQFRGVIDGGVWNPERNSIYVSFNQDKDLREDAATRATDGSETAGRNYRLQGKNIKVTGTDPAVGIVLIDEKGTETKLPMDMIAVNNPSEVLVLLPADLKDGTYELRLTTQYCHSSQTMLKTPRTVSRFINIGASQGSGDDDIVDDPTA